MPDSAESRVQALLTLPSDVRRTLLGRTNREDLQDITQYVVIKFLSRTDQEDIILNAFSKRAIELEAGTRNNKVAREHGSARLDIDSASEDEAERQRITQPFDLRPTGRGAHIYSAASQTPYYQPSNTALSDIPRRPPPVLEPTLSGPYVSRKRSTDSPHNHVPTASQWSPTSPTFSRSQSPGRRPSSPMFGPSSSRCQSPGYTPGSPTLGPALSHHLPACSEHSLVISEMDHTSSIAYSLGLPLKRPLSRSYDIDQARTRVKAENKPSQLSIGSFREVHTAPTSDLSSVCGAVQIVDLASDYEPSDSKDDQEIIQAASRKTTNDANRRIVAPKEPSDCDANPDVRIYPRVVKVDGIGPLFRYESLDKQPSLSRIVRKKFDLDVLWTPDQKEHYLSITQDPEHYLGEYQCLHLRIESATRGSSCTYVRCRYQTGYACDRCILRKKLCIRPANVNGDVELVIYPLPAYLRLGADWQQESYWTYSGVIS